MFLYITALGLYLLRLTRAEGPECKLDVALVIEMGDSVDWLGPEEMFSNLLTSLSPGKGRNRTSVALLCSNSMVLYRFNDPPAENATLANQILKSYLKKNSTYPVMEESCEEKMFALATTVMFAPEQQRNDSTKILMYLGDLSDSKLFQLNKTLIQHSEELKKHGIILLALEISEANNSITTPKVTWLNEDLYYRLDTLKNARKTVEKMLSKCCSMHREQKNETAGSVSKRSNTAEGSAKFPAAVPVKIEIPGCPVDLFRLGCFNKQVRETLQYELYRDECVGETCMENMQRTLSIICNCAINSARDGIKAFAIDNEGLCIGGPVADIIDESPYFASSSCTNLYGRTCHTRDKFCHGGKKSVFFYESRIPNITDISQKPELTSRTALASLVLP